MSSSSDGDANGREQEIVVRVIALCAERPLAVQNDLLVANTTHNTTSHLGSDIVDSALLETYHVRAAQ